MKKIKSEDYDNYSVEEKKAIEYPVIIDYGKRQMLLIEKGVGIDVTGDKEHEINKKYDENKERLDRVNGGKRKTRRNRKSKKGKRSRKARKSRRKSKGRR